jgi:hypothetical protein
MTSWGIRCYGQSVEMAKYDGTEDFEIFMRRFHVLADYFYGINNPDNHLRKANRLVNQHLYTEIQRVTKRYDARAQTLVVDPGYLAYFYCSWYRAGRNCERVRTCQVCYLECASNLYTEIQQVTKRYDARAQALVVDPGYPAYFYCSWYKVGRNCGRVRMCRICCLESTSNNVFYLVRVKHRGKAFVVHIDRLKSLFSRNVIVLVSGSGTIGRGEKKAGQRWSALRRDS